MINATGITTYSDTHNEPKWLQKQRLAYLTQANTMNGAFLRYGIGVLTDTSDIDVSQVSFTPSDVLVQGSNKKVLSSDKHFKEGGLLQHKAAIESNPFFALTAAAFTPGHSIDITESSD